MHRQFPANAGSQSASLKVVWRITRPASAVLGPANLSDTRSTLLRSSWSLDAWSGNTVMIGDELTLHSRGGPITEGPKTTSSCAAPSNLGSSHDDVFSYRWLGVRTGVLGRSLIRAADKRQVRDHRDWVSSSVFPDAQLRASSYMYPGPVRGGDHGDSESPVFSAGPTCPPRSVEDPLLPSLLYRP